MEQLLEKIAHNTEPKESFQIVVNDTKTRFVTKFNSHIQFKKNKSYEIALAPGYKIIETPANLVYLPITLDAIYSMEITLTDQNGQQLTLRGENISIRFHVREI